MPPAALDVHQERRPRGRPRRFNKAQALDQAITAFWRRGFAGTSLADLCAVTGLAATSLYAAFGSKEELFRAALAEYRRRGAERMWAQLATSRTAKAGIATLLETSASAFTDAEQPTGCLIVFAGLEGGTDDTLQDDMKGLRDETSTMIEARLLRACDEGELHPGLDIAAIARFYATVQQGLAIQARDGQDLTALRKVAGNAMTAWDALTGR